MCNFFGTKHLLLWSMVVSVLLAACSPYKTLPKNRYLLKKNKVKINIDVKKPKTAEIEEQIIGRPNRKILGIYRFHLRAYSLGTSRRKPQKNETKKIRRWLRNKVGEAPVLFDSANATKSVKNINQLFFNKGYFNSTASFTAKKKGKRRRRVKLTYLINPGQVYTVNKNVLLANEYIIDSIIEASKSNKLIKSGDQVDFSVITKERARLDDLMQNSGYFYFGKEFIEFDLDTANQQANINTVILNEDGYEFHRRVKYDSILIVIPKSISYQSNDGISEADSLFFDTNGYPLKLDVLSKRIFGRQGDWFNKSNMDKTFSHLTELKLFKSIDIIYKPSPKDSSGLLNVVILLNPFKKQSYSIEPQGVLSYDIQSLVQTNQNRNIGVGNILNYTNRNLFGGAEQFNLTSLTSFQAQIGGRSNTNFEQSINARLNFPGSRFLKSLDKNPKVINYSTQISIAYIFQQNQDFKRNILPANYSYLINKKNNNNWLITPVEINFNRSTVNPTFFSGLSQDQKEFLNILFARNFMLSSSITYFTFRTSKNNPNKKWFIKSNVLELGGNSLYALSSFINAKKDTLGTYQILGVPYSQFARTDIDLRLTHKIDQRNTLVYRLNTGIALPYGNRDFLPVDKRYFIGGANSLRGWNPRAMGPGNFADLSNTNSLDRTAELLVLGNFEYRFDVVSQRAEMALFFDAGNVWNIVEGNNPKEKFTFGNFLPSTALNTGIGLRLNFQFFLFRLDWAIRMHDPSLNQGERWVITDFTQPRFITNQTLLNVGLDYPF